MDEANRSKQGRKSRGDLSPTPPGRQSVKVEVCQQVLRKLAEANHELIDTPGFAEALQAHFNRLPNRYAVDVNAERAEDVLMHKDLLVIAEMPENRPAFHIRAVHVFPVSADVGDEDPGREDGSSFIGSPMQDNLPTPSGRTPKINVHPPPTFGSAPNFEDIDVDLAADHDESEEGNLPHAPMHEVCFSTTDKPKLLSQLSSLLADVGLNIREAHVFSTSDGYSLDVFVVDGWHTEDTKELGEELERVLASMEEGTWSKSQPQSPKKGSAAPQAPAPVRTDSSNDWEIDSSQLKFGNKVASGAFGDLYRGTYCGQDVAIKILKHDHITETLQHEFQHELFIMRKIRHKNVVQFIGACTKPPNLSIVTEFMTGGSVYDHIHKHRSLLKLPMVVRAAIDISKGMDYLHQNNIIHRDLKAANLLLDENEVVKVADFGVARVQDQRGIMTAETGTYRWMAPEVIEHKTYDRKVDVFSFAIVLWELLTGKLPYSDLTPLQAAVGVVQKGLRPSIPKNTNPKIASLLERCWKKDATERPDFAEITVILQDILKEVEVEEKRTDHKKGFLSALKRTAGNR